MMKKPAIYLLVWSPAVLLLLGSALAAPSTSEPPSEPAAGSPAAAAPAPAPAPKPVSRLSMGVVDFACPDKELGGFFGPNGVQGPVGIVSATAQEAGGGGTHLSFWIGFLR